MFGVGTCYKPSRYVCNLVYSDAKENVLGLFGVLLDLPDWSRSGRKSNPAKAKVGGAP